MARPDYRSRIKSEVPALTKRIQARLNAEIDRLASQTIARTKVDKKDVPRYVAQAKKAIAAAQAKAQATARTAISKLKK